MVSLFPKEQTVEVTRGERLNTDINKMKSIWGEGSREAEEKVQRVRTLTYWFQRERIQGLLSPAQCWGQTLCVLQPPGCHLSLLHSSTHGTFADTDL